MTTPTFNRRAETISQVMNRCYELFTNEGKTGGTFACPKCGSQVRFNERAAHIHAGQCAAACGVKWPRHILQGIQHERIRYPLLWPVGRKRTERYYRGRERSIGASRSDWYRPQSTLGRTRANAT